MQLWSLQGRSLVTVYLLLHGIASNASPNNVNVVSKHSKPQHGESRGRGAWHQMLTSGVRDPFQLRKVLERRKLSKDLETTRVQAVCVQNSTVLPAEIVSDAIQRAELLGNLFTTDRLFVAAKHLHNWYNRKGYILHRVTGAKFNIETSTTELTVDEPKIADPPLSVSACREMVIGEGGELSTFRQYLHQKRSGNILTPDKTDDYGGPNTTFLQASARTNPSKLARAMGLTAGEPFRWSDGRWHSIATSGIFSRVLAVQPMRLADGTVQVEVNATEAPSMHMEYGVGKSMYTGGFEGEVEFERQNAFGGGEVVGLSARRGTKDHGSSFRLLYEDGRFGLGGGYDIELFSDSLGMVGASKDQGTETEEPCSRKGAALRLRNLFNARNVADSLSSARVERTSSTSGHHEHVGSATISLGPIRGKLPLNTQSSLHASVTGGVRLGNMRKKDDKSILPFTSASIVARQIVPIGNGRHPWLPLLALQNRIATASEDLPPHEARAMRIAAQIRGCEPMEAGASSLTGTTELRLPIRSKKLGDNSVVLFSDWQVAEGVRGRRATTKASIGVGLRKVIQGLPLKYDISYSSDQKLRAMFGLGPDFDV